MDSALLEQFLGPLSTQFQLPPLIEDENEEHSSLLSTSFIQRKKFLTAGDVVLSVDLHLLLLRCLARPKSASTQSRRDSDSSSLSRSRANSGIPSRTSANTSLAGGKCWSIDRSDSIESSPALPPTSHQRSRSSSGIPRPQPSSTGGIFLIVCSAVSSPLQLLSSSLLFVCWLSYLALQMIV